MDGAGGRVLSETKRATKPSITLTASSGGRTALLSERHLSCSYTAVEYWEQKSGSVKGASQYAIADLLIGMSADTGLLSCLNAARMSFCASLDFKNCRFLLMTEYNQKKKKCKKIFYILKK
jgi:hypothetical protein